MKAKKPVRMTWAYLRQHKMRLASAVCWRCLYELVPMQVLVVTGLIVDGLAGGSNRLWDIDSQLISPAATLPLTAAALIVIALFHGVSAYAWTLATARLGLGFVNAFRRQLFTHAIHISADRQLSIGSGELFERILQDTAATRAYIEDVCVHTLTQILRTGYPLAILFILNFRLAAIVLAGLPVQGLINRRIENRLYQFIRQRRHSDSKLSSALKENLHGLETIQALNAHDVAVGGLNLRADQLAGHQLQVARSTALMRSTLWFFHRHRPGTCLVARRAASTGRPDERGNTSGFLGLVAFAYRPLRQFTHIVGDYRRGLAALKRIDELLGIATTVRERPDAVPLLVKEGRVAIEEVTFAYDTRPVFRDFNLRLAPHQLVAVVGRKGAGKSTLLKLLVRLHDPQKGRILIDGQPIDGVTIDSLRSQIALVGQHSALFSGTILDNIRMARPGADLTQVKAACRLTGALEFIEKLDQSFETPIGTGGLHISAGEAKRITIARALLTGPGLLLMDGPCAAIDPETEAEIIASLIRLKQHTTIVLTARHAQAIPNADHVVVMDDGRIISQGKHRYLREHCRLYRGLCDGCHTLSQVA